MREDEVNDELHLVDALEIRVLRLIARLNQRVKTRFHQRGHTAAEDALLAEQVGLGLLAEGRLENARARAADARGIRQRVILRLTGSILVDGDEVGHAFAFQILAADGVAGALRRDHHHVDILRRLDAAKVDVEAVREGEDHAGAQIRLDVFMIHRGLLFVVDEDHDHVGDLGGLGGGHDGQPGLLGLLPALAALVQRDNHVAAGVTQVERVRVSLRAVADDGNLFAHEIVKVAVLRVKHLCHFVCPPCFFKKRIRLGCRPKPCQEPAVPGFHILWFCIYSFFLREAKMMGFGDSSPNRSGR